MPSSVARSSAGPLRTQIYPAAQAADEQEEFDVALAGILRHEVRERKT